VGKTKIPEDVMKYFRATGAEGGKARAERHTLDELSSWGKKGGRPKGTKKAKSKGVKSNG
jgi:hypothetical protein